MSRNGSRALIAAALLGLLVVAVITLPMKEWLRISLSWTAEHRTTAAALSFVGLYVVASVCLLPGLVLTIAAGSLSGLGLGTVMASIGSVLGATDAFILGRTPARDWIGQRIQGWPKMRALDRALGARGFWIVLLTRRCNR